MVESRLQALGSLEIICGGRFFDANLYGRCCNLPSDTIDPICMHGILGFYTTMSDLVLIRSRRSSFQGLVRVLFLH